MHKTLTGLALALGSVTALALPAVAGDTAPSAVEILRGGPPGGGGNPGGGGGGAGGGGSSSAYPTYSWMSPDVGSAFSQGYFGQGTTMTFVDDFTSGSTVSANLGDGTFSLMHGEWTSKQAGMVAPEATILHDDYNVEVAVAFGHAFDVVNASYGLVEDVNVPAPVWSDYAQEDSIIQAATSGLAFVAKSAGNASGAAIGDAYATILDGQIVTVRDYFSLALVGSQSAIFVGALNKNGTPKRKASIASYSTIAGNDPTVQGQFLTVGVDDKTTGLAGTSFAAPIVAGYAAVLHSKFDTASPTQVANQLLSTARTDTIRNYSASVYGMGEACLSCALAPSSLK